MSKFFRNYRIIDKGDTYSYTRFMVQVEEDKEWKKIHTSSTYEGALCYLNDMQERLNPPEPKVVHIRSF